MNTITKKWNQLDAIEKELVKTVCLTTFSAASRFIMYKKGMVKSFWYGLPRKPHTYR